MYPGLSTLNEARLRADLLAWYDRHRRDLPWRGAGDPYAIWVSEIMLQQTRVAVVRDYFVRWMERFPDLEALAGAEADEVMGLWAGLGYYRRARMLHEAARLVRDELGGRMPADVAGLRALPGVGPYTAGAIASIAYGQEAALVDGNVERVFARLYAIGGDPKSRENQRAFWSIAERLVVGERPGDLNQALMELGATVCTPRSPSCLLCPVRACCQARALGEPEAFPGERAKRRPVRMGASSVVVVAPSGALAIARRAARGLWGGMYEAPSSEPCAGAKGGGAEARALSALEDLFGAEEGARLWSTRCALGATEHALSHRTIRYEVWGARAERELAWAREGGRWVAPGELAEAGLSAAQRRVFELAGAWLERGGAC